MIPWVAKNGLSTFEKCCIKNCATIRNHIRTLIEERKSGKSQSYLGSDGKDVLDSLTDDDYYQTHEDSLIDDIIVMFIAGMETIQMSTTNTIQHLIEKPQLKKRLIEETEPILL